MTEPADLRPVRLDLMVEGLSEDAAPVDPFELFDAWLDHATELGMHNANAMAVATADTRGRPSVRNVLLRGRLDGGLAFSTNYERQTGRDLVANPIAEALCSWLPLERQVRFAGRVHKATADQSDAYFATRSRESRISAIASDQSRVIESREALVARHEELEAELSGSDPVRPDHWGGFVLVPERVEFWQGREHRLHDRLVYQRDGERWAVVRLAP